MERNQSVERTNPYVSVILPTFERRLVLPEAIESAFAQTVQDFELIVVDDGSTDGTAEALAAYDGRIRLLRQENRGVAAARNAGLRLARGEIVAFLDSDDRWLPGHLELVAHLFLRHPEAVLVSTSAGLSHNGRQSVDAARVVEPLPRLLAWWNFVGFPTAVGVRRSALAATGGFDERLFCSSDTDLYLRLALEGPFVLLNRRTFRRGSSANSLSQEGRTSGRQLESRLLSGRRFLSELERRSASPELIERAAGGVRFSEALLALDRGETRAFRMRLAEACRLFPELSTDYNLVFSSLYHHLRGMEKPAGALWPIGEAATAWPDPRSPTGLALRGHEARLALRRGRPRQALAALRATLGP